MERNSYSNDGQSQFPVSKDNWINVTSNLINKSRINHSNIIHLIPQPAKKSEVLTNLNEESESSSSSVVTDINSCSRSYGKKYRTKTLSVNSSTRKSHKIMICDSHVRNCATGLQHNLGAKYKSPVSQNQVPEWMQL